MCCSWRLGQIKISIQCSPYKIVDSVAGRSGPFFRICFLLFLSLSLCLFLFYFFCLVFFFRLPLSVHLAPTRLDPNVIEAIRSQLLITSSFLLNTHPMTPLVSNGCGSDHTIAQLFLAAFMCVSDEQCAILLRSPCHSPQWSRVHWIHGAFHSAR